MGKNKKMHTRYGITYTSEIRKDILKKARQINELRQQNYIKDVRPNAARPLVSLRNVKSRADLELLQEHFQTVIDREMGNVPGYGAGYKVEVWKNNVAEVARAADWITEAEEKAIKSLTQEQIARLNDVTDKEFGNVAYWYKTRVDDKGNVYDVEKANTPRVYSNKEALYNEIRETGTAEQKALLGIKK